MRRIGLPAQAPDEKDRDREKIMSHYDIAIIGAGAAGLAAGLNLKSSGRRFIVLEARDRIGGRAFTDTKTLGLPFDCGARWLHAAAQNPFTGIARRLGFRFNDRISWADSALYAGGGPVTPDVEDEADAYIERVLNHISEAGAEGRDVAYSEFLDPGNRWSTLVFKPEVGARNGEFVWVACHRCGDGDIQIRNIVSRLPCSVAMSGGSRVHLGERQRSDSMRHCSREPTDSFCWQNLLFALPCSLAHICSNKILDWRRIDACRKHVDGGNFMCCRGFAMANS